MACGSYSCGCQCIKALGLNYWIEGLLGKGSWIQVHITLGNFTMSRNTLHELDNAVLTYFSNYVFPIISMRKLFLLEHLYHHWPKSIKGVAFSSSDLLGGVEFRHITWREGNVFESLRHWHPMHQWSFHCLTYITSRPVWSLPANPQSDTPDASMSWHRKLAGCRLTLIPVQNRQFLEQNWFLSKQGLRQTATNSS